MFNRKLITTLGVIGTLAGATATTEAIALPEHKACASAIVAELGEGRLRTNVLQNSRQNGVGYHWINVRHRPAGHDKSIRYRVQCETQHDGQDVDVEIARGAWKRTRPHQLPKAVD